jgi:nucleoside-diphosphate-sugar epimerase
MRVLILGCGYVGLPLGAELVRQGHEVFGVRRSIDGAEKLKAAGVQILTADITNRADLDQIPSPFDWIVNLVSSTRGGVAEYQRAYFEGTRNVIDWLSSAPPQKYLYTSSTGVYGQNDGTQVKETSPVEPPSETGKVLVETEQLLLQAHQQKQFPMVILRVAGIYGPDRTYFLNQFIDNQTRIAGQGERLMNMVHVEDLVGIICAALKSARPGEIYNAVDDEPVTQLHFYRWLAETLGKYLPPFSTEDDQAGRKRGVTNKKVLNRKLKMELGFQFKYPTFRQGYTAEIQRLDQAGLLNIELEPR